MQEKLNLVTFTVCTKVVLTVTLSTVVEFCLGVVTFWKTLGSDFTGALRQLVRLVVRTKPH